MMFKYVAFVGMYDLGQTYSFSESLERYFTRGIADTPRMVDPSSELVAHGLAGSRFDQMMLALRREDYRAEIWASSFSNRCGFKLNLSHCFTPAGAVQQAIYDIAEGMSFEGAQIKLLSDIAAWKKAARYEFDHADAFEISRHISEDIGQRFAKKLFPGPSFFETKEMKAKSNMASMESRAMSVVEDAFGKIAGPIQRARHQARSPGF